MNEPKLRLSGMAWNGGMAAPGRQRSTGRGGPLRRALTLRADVSVAHLRLGELLLVSEEFSDASQHIAAAYRGDDSDPRTHYDMARLLVAQGDLSAARCWAEQAVQLAPGTKSVHELLATIHQRLGDRESARDELKQAEQTTELALGWKDPIAGSVLAMRPDVTSLLEHAEMLLSAGQIQESVKVLYQALNADDRDPRVYSRLARTLINARQLPEAQELLIRAERRHPKMAEIQFQRGNVEFLMQRLAPAEQSFRRAVTLHPDFALAHYNLGHVLVKLDRGNEALESFETAAKLRPEYADAYINAGKLWLQQGNRERARHHLRQAEQLKPTDRELKQLLDQAARP